MLVNPINQNFESSRVMVSRKYPKQMRKNIKSINLLNAIAEKKGVYLKFSPSKELGYTKMDVFRKGIDHVTDIPEYAVKNQTGDQVYISWEQKIGEKEMPLKRNAISDGVREFFGYAD